MTLILRSFFGVSVPLLLSAVLISCELLNELPRVDQSDLTDRERLAELRREIEAEIGTPAARRVSQCKVIAFGSKPCGGPWKYLVYSTAETNESRLKRLVNEYNVLEEEINRKEGIGSDCMFVGEPPVRLEGGICTSG